MRNLAVVCLLIGSLNVAYGQESRCGCQANGSCQPGTSAGCWQLWTPTLSKVPGGDRLFRVAPCPALPQAEVPCPSTLPPPLPALRVAGEPAVVWPRAHGVEDLRGHHGLAALALERLAQDSLGGAVVVHVRRIEETHAPVQGEVDHADRFPLVGLVPEGHGAYAGPGHVQAAVVSYHLFLV